MTRAYLAVGSNLGDRLEYLRGALGALKATPGVDVVSWSRVYETAPVGGPEQHAYLNAVIALDTDLDPYALLEAAQNLERDAERLRTVRWGPRTLDVDILLFGEVAMDDPKLTIPHPRMWDRPFVLIPLRDVHPQLAVEFVHDPSVVVFSEELC